jgi:glycosyltransferase involved in cell wall biosynthesis
MRISVITPTFNSARFLEDTIRSVLMQRDSGVDLEYIVVDGGSTDGTTDIVRKWSGQINQSISEKDRGPADAINKGLRLATGEALAWLNGDDLYHPEALARALETLEKNPGKALCFGHCRIIDESGTEIRRGITRFKEAFFPISSRFTIRSINYISQPAVVFRRASLEKAGPLREDLKAAFDYEFFLRLWRHGGAVYVPGEPLADFRWHPGSISGKGFARQFREEFDAAAADAGRFALSTLLHWFVRWGIVGCYTAMTSRHRSRSAS